MATHLPPELDPLTFECVVTVTEEREALVEEVMSRFSRFHDLRATSRNCMWGACFALLVAIIFNLDPLGTEEELRKEKYSPSFVTSCFFFTCICCASIAWCMIGFPVRGENAEFCSMIAFCASGAILTLFEATFVQSELRTTRLCASIFLLISISTVLTTVRKFCVAFVPILLSEMAVI